MKAREPYRSAGRHYHTWSHVSACTDTLRSFPCATPQAVFLALVFHDAVYVPGAPDNEAASARLAGEALRVASRLSPERIALIQQCVLATASHLPDPGASPDVLGVIDIDMSILGADAATYDAYSEGVMLEYCPAVASRQAFIAGRLAFLRSLHRAPAIFHTAEGVRRWDAAARGNLRREIARLEIEQTFASRALGVAIAIARGAKRLFR